MRTLTVLTVGRSADALGMAPVLIRRAGAVARAGGVDTPHCTTHDEQQKPWNDEHKHGGQMCFKVIHREYIVHGQSYQTDDNKLVTF